MKQILFIALLFVISITGRAEYHQHAISIQADKIVINTDSLGLPKSTTVVEILSILPELVERPSDYILQNYDIQINGKSVGSARDAVLQQIHLSDLKCVEVSENSFSNIANYGQGGSINLSLCSAEDGLSGAVNAESSNEANISGGLRLENHSNKWIFHGIATIENYMPKVFYNNAEETQYDKYRDFSEYAAIFMEYSPNTKNLFKLNVSEVYTNNRTWEHYADNTINNNYNRVRNTNVFVGLNYEHSFMSGSKICAEANYRYIPERTEKSFGGFETSYNHLAHNVYGEFKLEQNIIEPTTTKKTKLDFGVQYNFAKSKNNKENNNPTDNILKTTESTYYARPYIKLDAQLNKWNFVVDIDYQHFSYKTKIKDEKKNTGENLQKNLNTQLVALYHINNNNMLRMRYIHSLNRPSSEQLFPYVFFDPTTQSSYIGNPSLNPAHQNAFDIDYGVNLSTSDYHLELKASVEYSHTYSMIYTVNNEKYSAISYRNGGKTNLLMGDLGAEFRKGRFSAWLSGNIYHMIEDEKNDGNSFHKTFFNFLLRPVVNLGRGWITSMNVSYFSPITSDGMKIGKNCYGGIRISKSWRYFDAYIYGTQNLSGKEDTEVISTNPETGITTTTYSYREYMHSSFGAGVRYRF